MLSRKPEPTLTDSLAELTDYLIMVEEASRGHKIRMENEGWSPGAAEAVAATLHMRLVEKLLT